MNSFDYQILKGVSHQPNKDKLPTAAIHIPCSKNYSTNWKKSSGFVEPVAISFI